MKTAPWSQYGYLFPGLLTVTGLLTITAIQIGVPWTESFPNHLLGIGLLLVVEGCLRTTRYYHSKSHGTREKYEFIWISCSITILNSISYGLILFARRWIFFVTVLHLSQEFDRFDRVDYPVCQHVSKRFQILKSYSHRAQSMLSRWPWARSSRDLFAVRPRPRFHFASGAPLLGCDSRKERA